MKYRKETEILECEASKKNEAPAVKDRGIEREKESEKNEEPDLKVREIEAEKESERARKKIGVL